MHLKHWRQKSGQKQYFFAKYSLYNLRNVWYIHSMPGYLCGYLWRLNVLVMCNSQDRNSHYCLLKRWFNVLFRAIGVDALHFSVPPSICKHLFTRESWLSVLALSLQLPAQQVIELHIFPPGTCMARRQTSAISHLATLRQLWVHRFPPRIINSDC